MDIHETVLIKTNIYVICRHAVSNVRMTVDVSCVTFFLAACTVYRFYVALFTECFRLFSIIAKLGIAAFLCMIFSK